MSGITYGEWRSRMSAQVADEARQEYYSTATQHIREENAKLKSELLALKLILDNNLPRPDSRFKQ